MYGLADNVKGLDEPYDIRKLAQDKRDKRYAFVVDSRYANAVVTTLKELYKFHNINIYKPKIANRDYAIVEGYAYINLEQLSYAALGVAIFAIDY